MYNAGSQPYTIEQEGIPIKKSVQLTEAEMKLMQLLWEASPRTMRELTQALENDTHWTKHTVITLLKRMQQKGTVIVHEGGEVKTYSPAIQKEQVAREQTETLLSRMFSGKASLLVNHLVERGGISEQEIQAMMDILKNGKNGSDDSL